MADEQRSPEDVCVLIPRTGHYDTFHGQTGFTDAMKLKTSRWADSPELTRQTQ